MNFSLKDTFKNFILDKSFPCVMAKAIMNNGFFNSFSLPNLKGESTKFALKNLQNFVTEMNEKNAKLSSCAIVVEDEELQDFETFEKEFWKFLKQLNSLDKKQFSADPTVDSDPSSPNFSYSIKSESFFIIALHPNSPRWARRFAKPAIVFNPHKQFEEMRSKGTFNKVRDLIRGKDKQLQGTINPMLENFGQKSEVYQYLGKIYDNKDPVPLKFGS